MKLLFGPELLWVTLYGLVAWIAKKNALPSSGIDKQLENLYWYIPLAVLLTFALFYFPWVEKRWLLARIWITCLIAGNLTLTKGLNAHSQQGPGIGTAYIIGIIFVFVTLSAGSIGIKIFSAGK